MIKKIILGISGSIAAYKSIELAKLLIDSDFEVEIILSKAAQEFISPLTLRSLFPGKVHLYNDALDNQDKMLHINLAKSAELILIAPASANITAKLANGLADCLLTEVCLASKASLMIAPAMNKAMWNNSLLQTNVEKLKEHNATIIGPDIGAQACGDYGEGRMLEPTEIVEYVKAVAIEKILLDKEIVITAGATQEKLDPVRYLTNHSSGKMGYALAKIANFMGAKVTLISGNTQLKTPSGVKLIKAETADKMLKAALETSVTADIFIGAAAVSDYKPLNYSLHKLKKSDEYISINLQKNTDIIANIKKLFPSLLVVGFAAETTNFEEYGIKKLDEKNLDLIAINDVSGDKTFGQDTNELLVITKDNRSYHIDRDTKDNVAQSLLEIIARI